MSKQSLTGQSYRNFIETIHSQFTRIVYKNSLQLYMKFRKVDDCSQLLKEDPRLIQAQIIEYIIYLRQEKKIGSNTINSNLAAIKRFYETNDIELRWAKIKCYVGKGRRNNSQNNCNNNKKDRPYTHLEISKMLEKADQRGKIAILLMASAGIRVGAISSLKIRNLEKVEKYNLYKLTIYENEDEEYITFCTPECAASIDSYLEYRQRHGERPLKEDSPLIREEFDIHDEIMAARPKALQPGSLHRIVKDIGYRSGVIEKRASLEQEDSNSNFDFRAHRRPVKETHGFRKFFQTTAINAGMSPLYSEFLMGHRGGGLALESYVRPSESDLLEGNDKMLGYIGVIDALTINEENKLRRAVTTLKQREKESNQMLIEMQKKFDMIERRLGMK